MKKKKSDWEMPKGKLTRVKDFLPLPGKLDFPKSKRLSKVLEESRRKEKKKEDRKIRRR